jgi:hypothetical protein
MTSKRTDGSNAKSKMKRKAYDRELQKLQIELCHLQGWVKETGARIIILFEGRDAAGKGGTIKAITERVSPRVFRVVDDTGSTTARSVKEVALFRETKSHYALVLVAPLSIRICRAPASRKFGARAKAGTDRRSPSDNRCGGGG